MTSRYTASDVISVFEASLLWFDKDPRQRLNYGPYDWIVLLTRDREAYDLACKLLSEIECGSIAARAKSWVRGIPE